MCRLLLSPLQKVTKTLHSPFLACCFILLLRHLAGPCSLPAVYPSEDFLEEVTTELEEFPGISQAEAVSKGDPWKGKEQGQGVVRCRESMASSKQPLPDVAGAAGACVSSTGAEPTVFCSGCLSSMQHVPGVQLR